MARLNQLELRLHSMLAHNVNRGAATPRTLLAAALGAAAPRLHFGRRTVSIGVEMDSEWPRVNRRPPAGPWGPPALLLLLLASLGTTGCSPSRVLAGAMLKAPNTYPGWLAPPARVSLRLPQALLTNLPVERVDVGPPPARLWVGLVPPGDYQARLASTSRPRGRRQEFSFSMQGIFFSKRFPILFLRVS